MQAGKLPPDFLSTLLTQIDIRDPRVVLGPRLGEDAALIDLGEKYLVAKTDPITFASELIGWYLVQINTNDLAVMGATPKWLMTTLLLPERTSRSEVENIFNQLKNACGELNISLIGGHTEVTHNLTKPIAVGAMLGEVTSDDVVFTAGARPGDSIVITKGIAIEGTAILAREAENALLDAAVPTKIVESGRDILFSPGISVAPEARIACSTVDVHSMHDPTEGGLATGLLELAAAAEVGLEVDLASIHVLPETREFCDALNLDPLGLIASGALIATVARKDTAPLIAALEDGGIQAWEIGRVTTADRGTVLIGPDGTIPIPTFERDELLRYFTKQLPST